MKTRIPPAGLVAWLTLFVVALLAWPTFVFAGVSRLYVKQDSPAGEDGTSWETAFDDLQPALDAATLRSGPVEIWVAEGVYRPSKQYCLDGMSCASECSGDVRQSMFKLFSGLRVLGGFAGIEESASQRNPGLHPTTLSGDLRQDDGPEWTGMEDNCYTILLVPCMATDVRVDGFVIRDGNDDSPTAGGGAALKFGEHVSDSVFIGCTFYHNQGSFAGGAVGIGASAADMSKTFVSCRFLGNRAGAAAGAVRCLGGGPCRFWNCAFAGNEAPGGGGALECDYDTTAEIINCTFYNNMAANNAGRAIRVTGTVSLTCKNTIFWDPPCGVAYEVAIYECSPSCESLIFENNAVMCSFISESDVSLTEIPFSQPAGADGLAGTLDDDFRLAASTLCIDHGNSSGLPADEFDIDGDGDADESLPRDSIGQPRRFDDITVQDAGIGGSPIVDIGATEFLGYSTAVGIVPWITPHDGAYTDPLNWFPGVPDHDDQARFVLEESYQVATAASHTLGSIVVVDGDVTLALGGTLQLSTTVAPAVVVGLDPGDSAACTLTAGGVLTGRGASIGGNPGTTGTMRVTGPGTKWVVVQKDLDVGTGGSGSLVVDDGGQVNSFNAFLGDEPGSFGQVTVAGSTSLWKSTFLVFLQSGEITLEAGGTIDPGVLAISGDGALRGAGLVKSGVTNFGDVDPGGDVPGTLVLEGDFEQSGSDPDQGDVSGRLLITLHGAAPGQSDALAMDGLAALAGGLVVELADGYDPSPPASHLILEAAKGVDGTFDVALLPGLSDGNFLTVNYPDGAGLGGTVTVDVASLNPQNIFEFLKAKPANIPEGVPIAATTCNIDGQPGLDLALVLASADDPRSKPGSLVVLLNADIQGGELVFGESYPFDLGVDPRAIVAANLTDEGRDGLDELIVAEFGEDKIRVLGDLQVGRTPMFVASYTVLVGDGPAAVTAADFTGDGKIDVATANMLSQDVSVLLNLLAPSMPLMPTSPLPLGEEGCSIAPNQTIPPDDQEGQEIFGLVVGSRTGNRVHVFPSAGGLRPFGQSLAPISVGPQPLDLIVADLNADGFDDIVTSNLGDGTVSVIVATGAATYAPAVHLPVGTLPGDNGALSTADFDLDGDPDIAVVTLVDGQRVAKVLRNDSCTPVRKDCTPGDSVLLADVQDVTGGGGALLVLSGDVDGDMDIDLLTIEEPTDLGDRVGGPPALVSAPPNSLISCPALPGDVNDDGFVNGADLGVLLAGWGSPGGCADLNGSGVVDGADLGILLSGWTG